MRDNYVMNIILDGGKRYSAPIGDEEWNAFIKSAPFADLNGYIVPLDILEELWHPEVSNVIKSVMLVKIA